MLKLSAETISETVQQLISEELCGENGVISQLIGDMNTIIFNLTQQLSPYFTQIPALRPYPPPDNAVNLSNSAILKGFDYVLNDYFGIDGQININSVIRYATNGSISLSDFGPFSELLPIQKRVEYEFSLFEENLTFGIDFSINDITVDLLDEVSLFDVFDPNSVTTLSSEIKWDEIDILAPINFNFEIISIKKSQQELNMSFPISIYKLDDLVSLLLSNVTATTEEELIIEKGIFLTLLDNKPVFVPTCGLKLFQTFRILFLKAQSQISDVTFLSYLPPHNLDYFFANLVTLITYSVLPSVELIINHFLMSFALIANGEIEKIQNSDLECTDEARPGIRSKFTLISFSILLFCCFFTLCWMIYRDYQLFRQKKNPNGATEHTGLLRVETEKAINSSKETSSDDESELISGSAIEVACGGEHSPLPWLIRSMFVVMTYLTFGLVLSYLSGIGASVYFDVYLPWNTHSFIQFPPLFDFDFVHCVRLFKNAHVYISAILIGLGGALCPICIFVLLLVVWLLPPRYLSSYRRIYLLQTAMTYVKWVPITGYLLYLLAVGFNVYISPPAFQGASVNLYVEGRYAYFISLLGTLMLSILLSFSYFCQLKYSRVTFDIQSATFKVQNRTVIFFLFLFCY
jgi:hypothetical protein